MKQAGFVFVAFSGVLFAADAPVTFTKDIAPIFQEKCEACHRKDSMAPMSLVTYQEVRPWAKSIRERVSRRARCRRGISIRPSGIQEFKNDRSLSDAQIATIVKLGGFRRAAWATQRTCRLPRHGPSEDTWQLAKTYGEPDLVIKSA